MTDVTHLSIVDGAFLHLETPEMPMHVGSLVLLSPPPEGDTPWIDRLKAHVASRMHLAPVFMRKLAPMPFDLANPVWIHDDDIDLDYHVRHMVLPKPGSLEQLQKLSARLHSMLLDRSRPLWEMYVIEGLADGRVGFYSKVHHAAVDGQAAVALATTLFDIAPEGRRVRPPRQRASHEYTLGVAELLSTALGNQVRQLVQFAKLLPPLAGTAVQALRDSRNEARKDNAGRSGVGGLVDGVKGLVSRLKFAPPTPFNHPITNQRSFAAVSLPLDEVKALGKLRGASVNDMVLWLCSTALRDYLADGNELPAASLTAGVPISLRAEGDASSNNQVSGALIELATHEADPLKRLAAIQAATKAMKAQMGVFGDLIPKDFPSLGSPWLLSGLMSLYGRSRLADRLRVTNVTISNVPGPQVPLYLAGAQLEGIYPLSIVVHGVALNITVQSYKGQLCFGLIACRRALPDADELGAQMQRAFALLKKLPVPVVEPAAPAAVAAPVAEAAVVVKRARKPKLTVVESAAAAAPAARKAARRKAA